MPNPSELARADELHPREAAVQDYRRVTHHIPDGLSDQSDMARLWEERCELVRERDALKAEVAALRRENADAASLRQTFYDIANQFQDVGKKLSQKGPTKGEVAFMELWEKLYVAIRDTTAGLATIKELADLQQERDVLQADSTKLAFVCRILEAFNMFHGADKDKLFWRTDGTYAPVKLFANCSDLFYWGTVDGVDITPENVGELERATADCRAIDPICGELEAVKLFCCRVNQMRPQGVCYKDIDATLWSLFDQCGPVRETGLGNPYPQPLVQV